MTTYGKVFGPTNSGAQTYPARTQIGSTYIMRPGRYTIYQIRVGKGNVVDDKEYCGIIDVEVSGENGPFSYAYGNGSGGATNSQNIAAEPIECSIPVQGGAEVKVYNSNPEAAVDVVISLEFSTVGQPKQRSYADGGAGVDTTADTELSILSTSMVQGGSIKQIRFAGSGQTDAKAGSGKLELEVPGQEGPFEYAIGAGSGGAATQSPAWADVINVDIPVGPNVTVTCKITTAEIMLSASVSIAVES